LKQINSIHRLFPICIGITANENLMRELAEQSGGACEMAGRNEDIAHAIVRTFQHLRHAEPMELNVDWGLAPLR
jgi:Ca-activated chloride channel family protein